MSGAGRFGFRLGPEGSWVIARSSDSHLDGRKAGQVDPATGRLGVGRRKAWVSAQERWRQESREGDGHDRSFLGISCFQGPVFPHDTDGSAVCTPMLMT